MSQPDLITVSNITKKFSYWSESHTTLKSFLVDLLRGKLSFGKKKEITVLEDVSFSIKAGEFVAIMGRNGAGKSTTLKLMSGIYSPTIGKIEVRGVIAPMIELGAGFDYELSGYENIFLNAAIMGYGRKEAQEKIQSIVEFSELGDLIQMPVKNYSSGMLVRLGFSIATHVSAPILLVDEVLAVGDIKFQEKCMKKVKELYASGRTIILVTHSPAQVLENCGRCIVISDKRVVFDGDPKHGVSLYQSL